MPAEKDRRDARSRPHGKWRPLSRRPSHTLTDASPGEEVQFYAEVVSPFLMGRRYLAVTHFRLCGPDSERVEAGARESAANLTEHVLASEALREGAGRTSHALTRVTTARAKLTASIAHEVNQPLATVVTFGPMQASDWLDREVPRIDKAT